jgi:hypothetical protein
MTGIREKIMSARFFRVAVLVLMPGLLLVSCVSQPPAVHEPVAGEFQAWADFNRNGTLEEDECRELLHAIKILLGEPHDVKTPVDEFFDLRRDGHIDPDEREMAVHILFDMQLERCYEYVPEDELVHPLVDLNQDRRVDDGERELIRKFLFFAPELRKPHDVGDFPMDRVMDFNNDKFVDEREIEEASIIIAKTVALLPLEIPEDAEPRESAEERPRPEEMFPVRSLLDELADLNSDGRLEPEEIEIRERALQEPHLVENEFDRRIDFNRDGKIQAFEIQRARRIDEVVEPELREEEAEGFPVQTAVDEMLDLNRDDRVDPGEIEIIVSVLTNREVDFRIPKELLKNFDHNGNGRVDENELMIILEMFLRPHPANPDFPLDKKLDKNRDGFVDPEEIGIAAGITRVGEIPPIEELLERLRWREEIPETREGVEAEKEVKAEEKDKPEKAEYESDFYKKLGEIQDKKFAVVGLSSATKNVDNETADGIVIFIENAFVNVGKVRVVDRTNITKIVAEYEFQQSELTDENTAVKIGRLSGADIIVIGSISYVGKKYYLNIKLISVETAEILGSSIAAAEDAAEFLDMCNEAVYKLF